MPQSLVLGNGSLLVGIDDRARIKDLYYYYVGLENHLTPEAVCKIGVWVEDKFSWFSDSSWQIDVDYKKETLVGDIKAVNSELEIEINFADFVYNEKNMFIREVEVINKANRERDIRIFFNHQFRMYGIYKKDTVYYDPSDKTIIQYKGRRVVLIGGEKNGKSFEDFSVGLSYIEGKEGTFRDAEDGALNKNPIEHGTVDSTIGFYETIDAGAKLNFSVWLCLGKDISEVKEIHRNLKSRKTKKILESTHNYWRAWVNKGNFSYYGLDKKVIDLFKRSLLTIRTQVDNTGAIIASSDSGMLQFGRDNYTYVWHRDASFVSMALDKAGYYEVTRRFFSI